MSSERESRKSKDHFKSTSKASEKEDIRMGNVAGSG